MRVAAAPAHPHRQSDVGRRGGGEDISARAGLRDLETGSVRCLSCRSLIGCDNARSAAEGPRHRTANVRHVIWQRTGAVTAGPACGLARQYVASGPACVVSAALASQDGKTRPRLVFVRGDRFHQRHQLTLYGLILDLAVGPQQSQAERAVEKQQAFDFPRLAVAVVEECDGYIQRSGDLLKAGGADAVDALFVFLNLLEADAKFVAELRLRDMLLDAP